MRMWIPHVHTPQSRFLFGHNSSVVTDIAEAHVAVVQRLALESNLRMLQVLRGLGVRIIYDLDDNIWSLPKSNPAKPTFDHYRDAFRQCAEWCDMITVSTAPLKKAVEQQWTSFKNAATGKRIPVVVIDNAIDFNMFQSVKLPRGDGRVIMGWAGSNTHAGDIVYAWEVLPEVLEENENLYMEFAGMDPPAKIQNHPRVRCRAWCGVGEWPVRFSAYDWDIAIAPLDDNKFNRSKSALKMMEAGAVGIPCLASPVKPYEDFCAHSAQAKWLLCYSKMQWKTKLTSLVQEPATRFLYGSVTKGITAEHYSIDKVKHTWFRTFDEVTSL